MPAQPLPATGAGEFVIRYRSEPHHLVATLLRRASTGALVELGTERVSYALAQDTLAGEDPSVPRSDELGWEGDPEELGALGKRIKKFAKKVAKSKLGKIVKSVGKIATSFVPGGSAITGTISAAKAVSKGVKVAKKLTAKPKPKPRPAPVYDYGDEDAAADEVGAVAKKPAAKKPAPKPKAAPKPAAKKPAPKPKAAPKPAAKKPAPKPKAAPKAKAPAKPKPAPKAKAPKANAKAPKPKAAPKAKPKASKPSKPITSAASKAAKVKAEGGAASKLLRAAATANSPAKQVQAQKLAQLASQIEDDAPELAATLAELPETEADDRDLVQERAVAAAQKLAATPAAERPALAAKMENRLDAYKVTAPNGDVVYVPIEEVEGGGFPMPANDDGDQGDDDEDDYAEG